MGVAFCELDGGRRTLPPMRFSELHAGEDAEVGELAATRFDRAEVAVDVEGRDAHPSGGDQLLGVAPGGDTGPGEDALQPGRTVQV